MQQRLIFGESSVRQALSRTLSIMEGGLDTDYTVEVAEVSPVGVVACYNNLSNTIFVNRENPGSAQYMQENNGKTAEFYLPILAHELTHNILTRHDNPFYKASGQLSSKLALAVADGYNPNQP